MIEARILSENTRVEQTHDGSGQPDECNSSSAHTVKEQHAPDEHREIASFNTNNEFNRAINEEDIDFKIPGLPHSTVNSIQKIENHPNRHALQRDLQQCHSLNPFSQESKEMIHEVGNIELCELLDMEPKAQCKVCLSYWDVGVVYCTCGHFLRNGTEENKKFVQDTMNLLSIPNYYIKKGRPHGHRYGKKPGDHEYFIANSLQKKCKKKFFLGIHDRFIRDEKFRKSMFELGRTEELCREMDKIGERRPHAPHHETIGGSVRTQLAQIRCQLGIDLTSNKHCQPCDSSNTKKIQLISKDGKVVPHLGGTGKNPGGILLMSITTKTDPALIDHGNLLKSDWDTYSRYDAQN